MIRNRDAELHLTETWQVMLYKIKKMYDNIFALKEIAYYKGAATVVVSFP